MIHTVTSQHVQFWQQASVPSTLLLPSNTNRKEGRRRMDIMYVSLYPPVDAFFTERGRAQAVEDAQEEDPFLLVPKHGAYEKRRPT